MSVAKLNLIFDDTIELLKLSRSGIKFSLFQEIVKAGSFSMQEWSNFLHITERTIQRYRKEKKKFEPIQSERIIEIAKLQNKGKEIFGSIEYFEKWLDSEIIALGGIKPKNYLDSSFGIDILMDELGRIEHGILA